MIQQNYQSSVEKVSGDVETTGFNIEINESMFAMLTSNIYNDTTLAVMREWSTNACDACIAAGVEVKFDVHLPTFSEPYFHVRDYGTGLAPEDITGLFSNLGASTKRNSDAYNGTLGIGRMAGLAVSNAFTVDSYLNGHHYSYAISMQKGIPVTMFLGELTTSEPNGLKLSVVVELDDIETYVDKAGDLYKYFDYKPTLNYDDINITLDAAEHISDDWFRYSPKERYDRTNYVVMSQVAYAIPYNSAVEDHGLTNLVIKAAPGAVTFNPGRESLSLNKSTISYLNEMFTQITEDYVYFATLALSTCSTDKEIMAKYSSVTDNIPRGISSKIDPIPFTSMEYQQLAVGNGYHRTSSTGGILNNVAVTEAFSLAVGDSLQLTTKSSYYKSSRPLDQQNSVYYDVFFSSAHVIIDLKTRYKTIVNKHFEHQSLICWQRTGKTDIDEAVQKAKDYLDNMGVSYTLASTIVDAAKVDMPTHVTQAREGLHVRMFYCKHDRVGESTQLSSYDVSNTTYLYLKLNNTTPEISDTVTLFDDYRVMYNLLSAAGSMPEVVGVPKKYQGIVDELSNWIDFETYIKEKAKGFEFKVPLDGDIPNLAVRLINEDNVTSYPKDIQDYYEELSSYHNYNQGGNYLSMSSHVTLAKNFETTAISYSPTKDIDLAYLSEVYVTTLPLLNNRHNDSWRIDPVLVTRIAALEEFYAVHSTK